MLPHTWQAKNPFANWTFRRHIIAFRWLTNSQLKCWPSISLAAHLNTDVWNKTLAGRCPHSPVLWENISTKSLKRISAPYTWTTSASPPTMPTTSLPTWEQPLKAFRRQALNWQCPNLFWCYRKWFHRTNHYPTRRTTKETKCTKLSWKDQFTEVEKGFTALFGCS